MSKGESYKCLSILSNAAPCQKAAHNGKIPITCGLCGKYEGIAEPLEDHDVFIGSDILHVVK